MEGRAGEVRGRRKAALAPLSHSIPAKEEVPVPDRAPLTVSPSPPVLLPRTKPPAPLPPELPSKANLPFVPEFGEYEGGQAWAPQIFPCPKSSLGMSGWVCLPIHHHLGWCAVPSSPISQSVCPAQPCLGLSLLHPLLCLLGWGFSWGARSRLGIWVHPLSREGEQRVCTDSESNRTNSWRKNKPIRGVKSVRLQMTPSCGRWGLEAAGGARQEQDTALSPTAGTPDPLCSLQKLSVPTSPLLGGVTSCREGC